MDSASHLSPNPARIWTAWNTPAVGNSAVAVRRNDGTATAVCTSIAANICTGATAMPGPLSLQLVDSVAGVIWSKQVKIPANSVWEINLSGLLIIASPLANLTLQFKDPVPVDAYSSCAMTGYDTTNHY